MRRMLPRLGSWRSARALALVGLVCASSASAQDSVGLGNGSGGSLHVTDPSELPPTAYLGIRSGDGASLTVEEMPTAFAVGDAVIVWQTALDVVRFEGGTPPELGRVHLTRITGISGMEIVLDEAPDWNVERGAQLVRVIELADFRLEEDQVWFAQHYDGHKGGMLALFVQGEARIDGTIDIVGGGYDGGLVALTSEVSSCGVVFTDGDSVGRGDGGARFFDLRECRGLAGCGPESIGLGGGSASAYGFGGGGGSNAGAGGSAFLNPDECPLIPQAMGAPVSAISDRRIFLGGGGGGGATLSGTMGDGGNGGGVVFIRAGRFLGVGDIVADALGDSSGASDVDFCGFSAEGGDARAFAGAGGGGRILVSGLATPCISTDAVAPGEASSSSGAAEPGMIHVTDPLDCARCAASGFLCDPSSLACAPCTADSDCSEIDPSHACGGDGACFDACAGACGPEERCVPTSGGAYECAGMNGCTNDDECRLALCDVAMNVCVPGACRMGGRDCPADADCVADPLHEGLGMCRRRDDPPPTMPPPTTPPSEQFSFSGGGGCSVASAPAASLAGLLVLGVALRRRSRSKR
jgi:hypothetical protein